MASRAEAVNYADRNANTDKLGYKTTAILMGVIFAVYTWPIPVFLTSIDVTIFTYPFSLLWVIGFGPIAVLILHYIASRHKWKKELELSQEDS